jgi:SPP1 gp7 family putative phage head morphogenesis protein
MRQRIIDNIDELGRNLKKFSVEGTQITIDGQTEAAILANDATQSLVEAAAGKKPANVSIGTSWTNLPDEQLQAFVGFAGDGSPLAELFNKIPQVTTDAMQMALVQGISLGEGPRTVARRVRKAADIGRQRAETIARTEMIRASREAQRQLYTQNPAVQGYRRQATQDARVCLACLALSGTLQATDTIMPSHPNCRCVMIPATMSWAEITGDDSIPDTRPEVATPDRILAGLTDAEKIAIMGPARFELYKNGKPLLDMVQVKQDKDWGPTTRVLPLKDIGGPLVVTPPKPLTLPKQVEAPKPVEVVKPSINRDPQALLDAFRGLLQQGRSQEAIQRDIDQFDTDRAAFFASWTGRYEDAFAEWKKIGDPRLDVLWKEQQGKIDRKSKIKDMHELMFSSNPQKIGSIWFNDNLGKDEQINVQHRKGVIDCIDYVLRFIDDRPLVRPAKSLLSRVVDVNQISIISDTKTKALGYCEWHKQGRIAINTLKSKLPKEFSVNFADKSQGHNTLAHELVHWIDARDPSMRKRVSDFYEKRTAGEKWIKSPYGGQYKKDKWKDPYMGQRYEDFEPQGYGLEVPTRGMELLLADPLKFAEDDFEYFSFMVTDVLGLGK